MVPGLCVPFLCLTLAAADQEVPKEDPLPPPRAIAAPAPLFPPAFVRPNRYDVWQNYAVDRYGRFRPLVIGYPYGPYYYADGKPYPWALMRSLHWLPYVMQ